MWIPTPIYESLPYALIVGGVLLISGTLYIGLQNSSATLYIGTGLFSIVYGTAIFSKRQAHRRGITKPVPAAGERAQSDTTVHTA